MNKVKTNNSYLNIKVQLRNNIIPKKTNITVLDCYHGQGEIWNKINKINNNKLNIISIDINKDSNASFIGNNIKYLKNLDLSIFDIIDLDSYGIPFKQLECIFNNKTLKKTIIFYTCIFAVIGALHRNMLYKLKYTKEMVDKIPTLFSRNGFEKFKYYLAQNKIKEINNINIKNKNYGYFIIDKNKEID